MRNTKHVIDLWQSVFRKIWITLIYQTLERDVNSPASEFSPISNEGNKEKKPSLYIPVISSLPMR